MSEKLSSEKDEVKASCYEETIWDDFRDEEVDEIYERIYSQLCNKGD